MEQETVETAAEQHVSEHADADIADIADDALIADALIDELLIEEISIDGMCGVY